MPETNRSSLDKHLLRVGAYVAGVFWVAFVWGALKVLSIPDTGRHSHLAGWTILVIAAAIMITTLNHWVKYLGVMLGGGVLGGILATMKGHLLNDRPIPRLAAAGVTALLIGCSLITRRFVFRQPNAFDRVALIGFLAACIGGFVKDTSESVLIGVGAGFGCLLAAWALNHFPYLLRDRSMPPNGRFY
jgi:hypothetical protein